MLGSTTLALATLATATTHRSLSAGFFVKWAMFGNRVGASTSSGCPLKANVYQEDFVASLRTIIRRRCEGVQWFAFSTASTVPEGSVDSFFFV